MYCSTNSIKIIRDNPKSANIQACITKCRLITLTKQHKRNKKECILNDTSMNMM